MMAAPGNNSEAAGSRPNGAYSDVWKHFVLQEENNFDNFSF